MKILVLSDSHSTLSFMRLCIQRVKPNAVVHLGDHYDDGAAMAEEFSHLSFYQVPGNCDRYRNIMGAPEIRLEKICGIRVYLTHGHLHRVKTGLWHLISDANGAQAQLALFGHTHSAYCQQEDNGMWVVNPGSCGYYGGSAAGIEFCDKKITGCRIGRQSEW